jgi:hypothetical protein
LGFVGPDLSDEPEVDSIWADFVENDLAYSVKVVDWIQVFTE